MQAFVFPGQGSQSVGMGKDVYDAFPEAREVFQEVDDALGQRLSKIIFEGPEVDLTLTENAQPALMVVSVAIARVLEKGGLNVKESAAFLAGHSLGEYSALCVSGALSLVDTARLLKIRGQAMQQAVPVGEGAMAAVLGLEIADVIKITEEATLEQVCAIANDNSPGQIVVSGHKQAVERAMGLATDAGAKRSILLPVSAPFHCALMKPAAHKMEEALAHVQMQKPAIPVIKNVTAEPNQDPDAIKELLVQQVTGQVRWRESILRMKSEGVTKIVEIGSGKVLTGLVKRIDKELEGISINTPEDIENF